MKHIFTRRALLKTGAHGFGALTAGSLLSRPLLATVGVRPEPVPPIRDPGVKMLAQRAIQAAREAGAAYADVRLTYTRMRAFANAYPYEEEVLHVGVRSLINGYWGFASSPDWHPDEVIRVARESARLAHANAKGPPREIQLSPAPSIDDQHWETPVEIDAFAVHPQEIRDFFLGLNEKMEIELSRLTKTGKVKTPQVASRGVFFVQEKAFASTENTYCTQRLHWSSGAAKCSDADGHMGTDDNLLTLSSSGWELFKKSPIIETIRRTLHENQEILALPVKVVDPGRYTTVFDAYSVATLLRDTIGAATELDRALGYEANASGTSYLSEPSDMLGAFILGSPLLTVTGNRNEPGGVATTRWDDEGVEPDEMTLVDQGTLNDFQTSREGAGWMRSAYQRTQRAFRSHGCAYAETGQKLPLIRTANLVMRANEEDVTSQFLEKEIDRGMSIVNMTPDMDFQCLNGASYGVPCYEIKGGKRVARIALAGIMFRSTEIWKNILAIAGPSAKKRFGFEGTQKGEPSQIGRHSVTAVPMVVKDVSIIHATQR